MSPADPGTPPTEPAPGADDEGTHTRGAEQHERFGLLQLDRVRKDDGRELIFFTDARESA